MPRSLYQGIAVLLLAGCAFAQNPGHITGQIQTATGGSITNGTLTFTLSQPSVVSGTATLVTQPVACYTSNQGNVVGVPDPIVRPILSTNTVSGTLPAATYFVEIYYTGPSGTVSAVSPEASIVLSAQGTVIVQPPALQPASATGYGVAISTTSGTETIQGTVTGFASQFQQSVPLITGATPAATNNTVCNIFFSDSLIPTGTYYSVNLVNKNGTPIAGFPQSWCTYGGSGGTINVSQGTPTGICNVSGVFYPTPILANTQNSTSQSILTALSVTGNLSVTGSVSATVNVSASGNVSAVGNVSAGTLNVTGLGNFATLNPSLPVCSDASKNLTSTCTGLIPNSALQNSSVTYNGQNVALGASGNVNSGAAAHSMALNEGNGSALTGLALSSNQVPLGSTGADPTAASLPACADTGGNHLNYSSGSFTCGTTSSFGAAIRSFSVTGCTPASSTDSQCTGSITISPAFADASYIPVLTANGNGGSTPNLVVTVNGALSASSIPYALSCTFSCGTVNAPTIYIIAIHP